MLEYKAVQLILKACFKKDSASWCGFSGETQRLSIEFVQYLEVRQNFPWIGQLWVLYVDGYNNGQYFQDIAALRLPNLDSLDDFWLPLTKYFPSQVSRMFQIIQEPSV
jgi:hypothetical protein